MSRSGAVNESTPAGLAEPRPHAAMAGVLNGLPDAPLANPDRNALVEKPGQHQACSRPDSLTLALRPLIIRETKGPRRWGRKRAP